jgi:outer membrane protein, multidrug efflux system
MGAPDLAAAEAARQGAQLGIAAVRANRRPHIDLAADVGAEPVLGSSFAAPFNTGRGAGVEMLLGVSLPLWDRGVYTNRLAAATLAFEQSTQAALAARRQVRSQWYQARADLLHLYEVMRLRGATVPAAQDAYLQSESLYRGGSGSALEVLDAYATWIQSGLEAARARLAYRIAEARAQRWGGEGP